MAEKQSENQKRRQKKNPEAARDEANKHRFVDQSGLAAQDLPEAAHGQNVVDPPEEITRRLPQQHGGEIEGDSGIRASMDVNDAERHGHRGKN